MALYVFTTLCALTLVYPNRCMQGHNDGCVEQLAQATTTELMKGVTVPVPLVSTSDRNLERPPFPAFSTLSPFTVKWSPLYIHFTVFHFTVFHFTVRRLPFSYKSKTIIITRQLKKQESLFPAKS